ncbi:MAG: hypothetical protein ISS46_00825 [Candidatus Omnitrophica bacterium]|nr:hypothetical protein [Candidatus Omnitrophota bacterium]
MKNIFVVIAIILCLTFFTKNEAQALVVGDEIIAGKSYSAIPFNTFQLGGIVELVFDKDLEPDTGNDIAFKGSRYLVKGTISPLENVDIYVKIGAGRDELDDGGNDVEIKSEVDLAYGGGLRANLITWEDSGMHLGLDAQFLRFDSGIDTVTISSTRYDSAAGNYTADQWQAALFLVKDFFQVSVYGGGQYSDSSIEYDYDAGGQRGSDETENSDVFGALAGINIYVTDTVICFIEGHLLDETSISVGLNARF